jgi:hypothetical protein
MSLLDLWLILIVVGGLALFLAGALVVARLARRHADDDPRAHAKVLAAVAFAILLGVAGVASAWQFEQDSRDGIHDTLVNALNVTIGDGDYWGSIQTVAKRLGHPSEWPASIGPGIQDVRPEIEAYLANHPEVKGSVPTIIIPKLRTLNATLDAYFAEHPDQNETSRGLPAFVAENLTTRAETLKALHTAYTEALSGCPTPPATFPLGVACIRTLGPNHAVWLQVEPLLLEGRDAEAEAIIDKATSAATITELLGPVNDATAAGKATPCARGKDGFCTRPLAVSELKHAFYETHELRNVPFTEGGPAAFDHQREYRHQMELHLAFLVHPGLVGLVMAPFAFAGGSILRRAHVPSDTVGFKPYPGKAAGWFLLLIGLNTPIMVALGKLGVTLPLILDVFAILAIPFAAWVLRDLAKRSAEGQIAL